MAALANAAFVPKPPGRFALKTLEDLEAEAEPDFIVQDLLKEGDLLIFYGDAKCGKTFLVVDFAALLSAGKGAFAGCFEVRRQARVVYAAVEGRLFLRYRFRAACDKHGLSPEERANLRFITDALPNLWRGGEEVDRFVAALSQFRPDVVIIDTLAGASVGCDENTPKDAGQLVANLLRIRDEARTALIVLHHASKASGAMRGSTQFHAAADGILKVARPDGRRTLQSAGLKDAEEFGPLEFTIEQSGTHPRHRVVRWLGRTDSGTGGRRNLVEEVVDLLRTHAPGPDAAVTAKEVSELFEVKPPMRTLERALQELRTNPRCVVVGELRGVLDSRGRRNRQAFHYHFSGGEVTP